MQKYADYIKEIEIESLWSGQRHVVWQLDRRVNVLSGVNGVGKSTILNKVVKGLAAGGEALDHLVEDGALAHAVDTAQHIDAAVQLPHDMTLPAPQRLYLYLLDVIGIFLHDDTG